VHCDHFTERLVGDVWLHLNRRHPLIEEIIFNMPHCYGINIIQKLLYTPVWLYLS
jgi:hypothetical protein